MLNLLDGRSKINSNYFPFTNKPCNLTIFCKSPMCKWFVKRLLWNLALITQHFFIHPRNIKQILSYILPKLRDKFIHHWENNYCAFKRKILFFVSKSTIEYQNYIIYTSWICKSYLFLGVTFEWVLQAHFWWRSVERLVTKTCN